jgi:hypothetical protein
MSERAKQGMALFLGKALCVKCHDGPHFTDNGFHNLGIPGSDEGRAKVVSLASMKGAFKTSTLRDVALTAPYFHDGSAATLEAVVEHYDKGGVAKDNLDPDVKPLGLTPEENAALVEFMKALTGRPIEVTAPAVPATNPDAVDLNALMHSIDEVLARVEKARAASDGKDWTAARAGVVDLLALAERIRPDQKLAGAARLDFSNRAGVLVVAMRRLDAAVQASDAGGAAAAYGLVRGRCQECHDVFRPEGGRK